MWRALLPELLFPKVGIAPQPHVMTCSHSKPVAAPRYHPVSVMDVNSVPYRPVPPEYTAPASKPVQILPLFRTGKNTGRTGRVPAVPVKSGYFGR